MLGVEIYFVTTLPAMQFEYLTISNSIRDFCKKPFDHGLLANFTTLCD
jgi:hypothetical protein